MSNKTLYRNLCETRQEIPVFAQAWWLDLVCDEWDAVLAYKGDNITGAWAYPVEQRLGVGILRTPRLTPYLGPQVFFPPDMKAANRDSHENSVVAELMRQMPATPVWNIALQPCMKQAGIFKKYGLALTVQQTFLIDLAMAESDLLANMKDTVRKNIRQGEKELTITDEPGCIDILFEYHRRTLSAKEKKIGHTPAELKSVMDGCIKNNSGSLWVARNGTTTEALVWQVWDKNHSYYFMGAQNPETNGYKAMTQLLWHCLKTAKKKGIGTFDLEGSMDEGVERFFRSFGARRELFMVLQRNDSGLWKLKKAVMG